MMKRSVDEILARIKEVEPRDFFGAQTNNLLAYVPFEQAKPYLNADVTEARWDEVRDDQRDPLEQAKGYLPFAWDKANSRRGLSAGRSMDHMRAWFWLAGYDKLLPFFKNYEFYGKPQLVVCSEIVGFDWRSADDGRWSNSEGVGGLSTERRDERIAQAVALAASMKESNDAA